MGDFARISVTTYLDSAHRLPERLAKDGGLTTLRCCNLHGHTYKVVVGVTGHARKDIVVDFGTIKKTLSVLDHVNLDDVFAGYPEWKDFPTTAENLCDFIHWLLCNGPGVFADDITIYEGYKGDDSNRVMKKYTRLA
jgi:6-pyruvoyl-tetrahydropterin synthase